MLENMNVLVEMALETPVHKSFFCKMMLNLHQLSQVILRVLQALQVLRVQRNLKDQLRMKDRLSAAALQTHQVSNQSIV